MKTMQKKLTERIEAEHTCLEDQDIYKTNQLVFLASDIDTYRSYFIDRDVLVKNIRIFTRSIIDRLKLYH